MKPNKVHIIFYLTVLACAALAHKNSSFTDHLYGVQAVSFVESLHQANDFELYFADPVVEISVEFYPPVYAFVLSEQRNSHYPAKSVRGPPFV